MNQANEILVAIQRKKIIYNRCLVTCKSQKDKQKLKKDLDELSKEEMYWLGQLDEEFKINK